MNQEKYEKLKRRAEASKERAYQRSLANRQSKPNYIMMDCLKEIRFSNKSGSHVGCVRISPANNKQHELRKFEVCYALAKKGHKFITEAIFESTGKRADVIDLSEAVVFEILCSETKEQCLAKTESYPDIFEIRIISANVEWKKKLIE